MRNTLIFVLMVFGSCEQKQFPQLLDEIQAKYQGKEINFEAITDSVNVIIIDCRSRVEYDVSHIRQAVHMELDNLSESFLKSLVHYKRILVYCSVGVRSSEFVNKLKEKGILNAYNIRGGVFAWVNAQKSLVNHSGSVVDIIHGYNSDWSQYITNKNIQIIH